MKRIVALFCAFALLSLCLVSCKREVGTPEETSAGEEKTEYEYIAENALTDYKLVISSEATDAVKSMASAMVKAVREKTETELKRITDDTSKYEKTEKEILLGVSERAEAKDAVASLGTAEWSISFKNGKLVIAASNNYCLQKAIDALLEKYFIYDGNSIKISSALNESAKEDMLLLTENGQFRYNIIIPSDADMSFKDYVYDSFMMSLEKKLSCNIANPKNDSYPTENGALEILLGNTSRAESVEAYGKLGTGDLYCNIKDSKIIIGSGLDSQIPSACALFLSLVTDSVSGTYAGDFCIPKEYEQSKTVNEWLGDIPTVSGGSFIDSDDIGDGTYVLCWNDVDKSEYTAYLEALNGEDFTVKEEYSLGDNAYTLMSGAKADIYVSYIAGENMLRVYGEKKNNSVYPSAEMDSYTDTGALPTLWQLENDWKGSRSNAGMSYVIRVSDGSFVIIDGGYNTKEEADALYNFLKSNVGENETPVVSAWIITHGHNDHIGALHAMTENYLDKIIIKGFYYNVPFEGYKNDYSTSFVNDMKKWSGAKLYNKLHSGMRFFAADAQFDVIYTHEDLYPVYSDDGNDTSLVIRMKLDGKTVMFLGDIQIKASETIEKYIPENELESDIVQYAHHGYEGATVALYDMIKAPTVLWPMNICGWQNSENEKVFENWMTLPSTGKQVLANPYIVNEAEYVKKIIVSGAGNFEIILATYSPSGNKLPDYETIYESIKNSGE